MFAATKIIFHCEPIGFSAPVCPANAANPAYFTAQDDDSIGEVLAGISTGHPTNFYASETFIKDSGAGGTLQNLRIAYAFYGIDYAGDCTVRNCEFANVSDAIWNEAGSMNVENVLVEQALDTAFVGGDGTGSPFALMNVTVHHANNLLASGTTLSATNSLFIEVTNLTHAFSTTFNKTNTSDSGVFQSVGFADAYLAAGSAYRDLGTTNIDPALLAELKTMTTYAPQDGNYPDTNVPDLGYHYPLMQISSAGTDFWISFLDVLEGEPSIYISSSTAMASTGMVTFAGILIDGPVLTVSGCGDASVNGTYYLTNTTGAEGGEFFSPLYVKPSSNLQVGFSGYWYLFAYDSGSDSITWLYAKLSGNADYINGNGWVIDPINDTDETNPPPTNVSTVLHPFTESFSLAAGQATNIEVNFETPAYEPFLGTGIIQTNGLHVTASQPVSVYALDYVDAGSTAFTCYSTPLLGTNYCILARAANVPVGSSEFGFVATEDGTTVTVTPSANADLSGVSTSSTNITLQQGQTYQFNSSDPNHDVTGTRVTATKPIGVFAGDSLAYVPDIATASGNPLVQEQLPVDQWGTNVVALSFAGRTNGGSYRILAASNNTVINITGKVITSFDERTSPYTVTTSNETVTTTITNAGQFYDIIVDGPVGFQANKPIQVAQFANGDVFDAATYGDPCEILLPAAGHYLQTSIIDTPGFFVGDYLNLIVAQAGTNSTFVDGSLVAFTNFTAIGTSGYYGAQLSVTNIDSVHTVTGLQPVGVEVYGFGGHIYSGDTHGYDAYGYFGGVVK